MKNLIKKIIEMVGLDNLTKAKKNGLKIGTGSSVDRSVYFGTEPYLIQIGYDVRLTQGVKFITHDGGLWVLRNLGLAEEADKFGRIIIGNNVNIGWNVIIMPDVRIGNNVVIGAGAIVTKNVPSNTVWAGVPAKQISTIEDYYEKNKENLDNTKLYSRAEKKKYLLRKYHL